MPTHVSTGQITIADVMDGAQGPAVVVTCNRAPSFLSTDGVLNSGQPQIDFTATVEGLAGATYAWAFAGLQTDPVASTTATQVVTAAQFGTSSAATVTCTVTSGGKTYSGQVSIYRVEKSTAAAGATVGASLGYATHLSTLHDSTFASLTGWTSLSPYVGERALVSDAMAVGGNAVRLGNNAGNDTVWYTRTDNIAFNATKLYRVRARLKREAGDGLLYVGLEAINASGQTIDKNGVVAATRIAAMHFVAAIDITPPIGEWVEYVGYVKGTASSGAGAYSPDPFNPGKMFTGTVNMRPVVVVNWPDKSGQVLLDYVLVEEVEAIPADVKGKITPVNASTWIADAAIGNAHIANAAVDTLSIKGNAVTVPEVFLGGSINSAPWDVEQQVVAGVLDFGASVNAENPAGLIGFFSFYMEPETVDAFGVARVTINGVETVTQSFGIDVNGGDARYRLPVVLPFSAKGITTQYVNVVCYAKSTTTIAGNTGLKMHILEPRMFLFGGRR